MSHAKPGEERGSTAVPGERVTGIIAQFTVNAPVTRRRSREFYCEPEKRGEFETQIKGLTRVTVGTRGFSGCS